MNHLIIVDTETTGLNSQRGDRLVEIGAVEIVNRIITGRTFHSYINPERASDPSAFAVHQLSEEFLSDKPFFSEIAEDFLEFIGTATLVIHNANFDLGFINQELKIAKLPPIKNPIIDSLQLARAEIKDIGNHKLDTLCDYYKISRASRKDAHGALIDSKLLADVYLLLTRKQTGLDITSFEHLQYKKLWRNKNPSLVEFTPKSENLTNFQELINKLNQISPTLWR